MAAGESPPVGEVFIDLQQVRWKSSGSGAVSAPGTALLPGRAWDPRPGSLQQHRASARCGCVGTKAAPRLPTRPDLLCCGQEGQRVPLGADGCSRRVVGASGSTWCLQPHDAPCSSMVLQPDGLREELGSSQLDSPCFHHTWDTRAEVGSEAASYPRAQICPRYRPESAVSGTAHPWALPPSPAHSPARFYSCLSLSHLLCYPGPTTATAECPVLPSHSRPAEMLGAPAAPSLAVEGGGGRQNVAQAALLPLSAQHRQICHSWASSCFHGNAGVHNSSALAFRLY